MGIPPGLMQLLAAGGQSAPPGPQAGPPGAPAPQGAPSMPQMSPASLPVLLALMRLRNSAQPPTGDGAQAGAQSMDSILPLLMQMLGGGMPGAPQSPQAAQQTPHPVGPGAGGPPGAAPPSALSPQVMNIVQMLASLGLMPHGAHA